MTIDQVQRQKYPNLTQTESAELERCFEIARRVSESEPADFFITDHLESSISKWGNLWVLLTSGALMEFYSFTGNRDFDYVPRNASLVRTYWKYENFDFQRATPESRLQIEGKISTGVGFNLTATGSNCEHLASFLRAISGPTGTWAPDWREDAVVGGAESILEA